MGRFETLRILDADGSLVGEDPGLDEELLREMYRNMVLSRELDRRMLSLQRQGRIGTYAMLEGQEAVQIGSALAMEPNDFVFPSYREHGVQITRGLPMEALLAYWRGLPNSRWDLAKYRTGIVTVPIATQEAVRTMSRGRSLPAWPEKRKSFPAPVARSRRTDQIQRGAQRPGRWRSPT